MCEALGQEPTLADTPVEYQDLYYECKQAVDCYHLLPSLWSGVGYYVGKDYTGIQSVFDLLDIHDNKQEIMQMIFLIDREVSEDIARKQKAASKAK